jgi:hypothetical protein
VSLTTTVSRGAVVLRVPHVPDHGEARVHTHANREVDGPRAGVQRSDRVEDAEARADGPARVVLMGLREAEVYDHPVAGVLRDVAVVPRHHGPHRALEAAKRVPPVFGVEGCR